MDKFMVGLPIGVLRAINATIALSTIFSIVGTILLLTPDWLRPASHMPWYVWLLVSYMFLAQFYRPPARLGIPRSILRRDVAWMNIAGAVFSIAFVIFSVIFLYISCIAIFFVALTLPRGIQSTLHLHKSREQAGYEVGRKLNEPAP